MSEYATGTAALIVGIFFLAAALGCLGMAVKTLMVLIEALI
ncbi:MAG: hypothetical protein ABFS17_04870 [Chloroflexota bacterium]